MGTHDFGNAGPGELHAAHDLVSDDSMIGHFTELFRIQRRRFAEKTFVDCDFANIVKVTSGPQTGDVVWLHSYGFTDRGGIATHPQRVAVNVHVLYVNGSGERFQCSVVETVERCQQ